MGRVAGRAHVQAGRDPLQRHRRFSANVSGWRGVRVEWEETVLEWREKVSERHGTRLNRVR